LLLAGAALATLVAGCRREPSGSVQPTPATSTSPPSVIREPAVAPRVYVDGLALPVALHFAPDGRLFFGEVNKGQVRVVAGGVLQARPFATLQVAQGREHGLLGLTLAPRFDEQRHVYVYYTVPKSNGKPDFNRVVRFTDRNGEGTDPQIILDKIPADVKGSHNGGRMLFGPDGKLYVATGIRGDETTGSQKVNGLEGKILRLNPDGSVPDDNPVPGSPVYALGLRNPYGIAFQPETGRLYALDNGPKGYDELNLIRPGANYGWPAVMGVSGDTRYVDPLWHSGAERLGLSGLVSYTGQQLPEYRGDLFLCLWNAGVLRRVRLGPPDYERVEQMEDLAVDCRLDVAGGPDGALYTAGLTQIHRLGR
jgi:glucose/arabinose dehydrogenase